MKVLLTGGHYFDGAGLRDGDVLVRDGTIEAVGQGLAAAPIAAGAEIVQAAGCVVAPGFTDLHVHFRQPGFEEKETVATGSAAAAAGGFTTVCTMPNLQPVPDDLQHLDPQLKLIEREATVRVLPYGALTVGERGGCLADISVLARFVCGFTDDGRGVQDEETMRRAMAETARHGSFVAAHCEVEGLLAPGAVCVQENSAFAKKHGWVGYSAESEWREVERDIALAKETGCRLHICHASTAETFALVRHAKRQGLPVTCEATPHNLLLSCDDIAEDSGRFRMNPPLRTAKDVQAAQEALRDGTIDAIATDHAPHTAAEKGGPFGQSLNGVVGLETAFAACYTGLVQGGVLSLEQLLTLLTKGPRAVLGEEAQAIAPGAPADLVLLDLAAEKTVNPETFKTKGRATPFAGARLAGWPVLTLYAGQTVYRGAR